MTRGPTGPAPAPPADLHARPLPLTIWDAGSTVVRIHRTRHAPIHFSGGAGKPPLGRWDSPTGIFGALYAAREFPGAFAETVLRNPAQLLVSLTEIEARALSVLGITIAIRLVDLTGPGLSQLGLDARILSGPYDTCGAWSDALHGHREAPAGILYPSRFDPAQVCVALFDRVAAHVEVVTAPAPLGDMLADVAEVLDRYGKALDPA
ncbi:MAG TPA: RES family NAD+ phosphorylase [Crenalkalicoccus sp.]|nr:RES family NAD+ phosphorylase [Crenalkalicoccus sp.]